MGFTQCTFTYTYPAPLADVWHRGVLERKRFDINKVVFMYQWRHPATGATGVLVTDMLAPTDWTFMGSVPAFIGAYMNDEEFWEMADAHARMMQ